MFNNPNGDALNADRLVVDTDMASSKAQCTGRCRLAAPASAATLSCTEAVFNNPDGDALYASGLAWTADMSLGKAQSTGQVSAGAAPTSAAS